jgi:hypothetical protein
LGQSGGQSGKTDYQAIEKNLAKILEAKSMKIVTLFLILSLFSPLMFSAQAQTANNFTFNKAKIIVPNGDSQKEADIILVFLDDTLQIKAKKGGTVLKTFKYSDIKAAEYSYTQQRMWKEGLGLGVSSLAFPPIAPIAILIALPLGFAKNKHHWLTFRSENDFAVLKISKSIRKVMIPLFETKTGIKVEGKGEDK